MLSSLPKTNFNSLVTFILSSANALSLDQSKILSFGKELNVSYFDKLKYVHPRILLICADA